MYVDWEYYKIFYYVAKYQNFTKAARVLGSNQPNITHAMNRLESQLNCVLFIRSNRGVTLTPEGELLYSRIASAAVQIQDAEEELSASATLEHGAISISATETALNIYLSEKLRAFHTEYPGIRLRISNHSTPQAVAALHETTADFAVITTPVTLSPSLTQTIVKEIREVPICAPAFSGLLGRSVALSELEAYPLITLGAGTTSHAFYVSVFTAQGVAFQPAIEAATADQIIPMAEAGLGVGIVPEAFIRPSDNVRRIELQEPLPLRAVCIVKRKGQPLSVAARELERMLLAAGAQST